MYYILQLKHAHFRCNMICWRSELEDLDSFTFYDKNPEDSVKQCKPPFLLCEGVTLVMKQLSTTITHNKRNRKVRSSHAFKNEQCLALLRY